MNNMILASGGIQSVALWLSVAVIAALFVAGAAIYFAKRSVFTAYAKNAALGIVTYAAVIGLLLLAFLYEPAIASSYKADYSGHYSANFPGYVLAPLCTLCASAVLTVIISALYGKFRKNYLKTSVMVLIFICYSAFAVGAGLINLYFADAVRHYAAMAQDYVYAKDVAEHVALWLTAPLAAMAAAGGTAVFYLKREYFGKFLKNALTGAVIYAAVLGIIMLALSFAKYYSMSYAEENWLARDNLISYVLIPLIVLCAAALAATIALSFTAKFKAEKLKLAAWICGAVIIAIFVAAAVMIGLYYSGNIKGDGYYDDPEGYGSDVNDALLYILSAALIVIAVAGALVLGRKDKKGFDTRTISYAAVCIALSFALSYVRLWQMPQGGSVTFASLLPLMIYSYMFGVKKGVFAGFIYGILQAVQDPWIIHPAQFLLDYPVAFAFIGFAGVFANIKRLEKAPQIKFALGAIAASVLRFISHVFSGVFAFSAYAVDAGMNAWAYSLAYNSFVFADIAIVIVAGVLVFSSKNFVKFITRYNRADIAAESARAEKISAQTDTESADKQ